MHGDSTVFFREKKILFLFVLLTYHTTYTRQLFVTENICLFFKSHNFCCCEKWICLATKVRVMGNYNATKGIHYSTKVYSL